MRDDSCGLSRRAWVSAVAALAAGTVTSLARAADAVLPRSVSLADELAQALKVGQPLVVMVSLEGCPFCRTARNNYLEPLRREQGVPVVQVDMRSAARVLDFKRAPATHEQLIQAWKVSVAPTVLFLGPGGKEVAGRLIGGYIEDFYGAYLDQRLEQARAGLKD